MPLNVPVLGPGRYFGQPLRATALSQVTVVESRYLPDERLARHGHENANFCLVLAGGFREVENGMERYCACHTLVYRPPSQQHAQRFSPQGGRCLNIEVLAAAFNRYCEYFGAINWRADYRETPALDLAKRLYIEVAEPDDLSAIAIDGLWLELLVACARWSRVRDTGRPPTWLLAAREYVRDRFRDSLTLADVAATVDVHPARLARAYRQHFRQSMAEEIRALRLIAVRRALCDTDLPLTRIAIEAGYSDQSHLTRAFHRAHGTTPAAFRRLRRSSSKRSNLLV